MTYTVGQQLWYQPNGYGRRGLPGYYVTIVKIGRKWLTVSQVTRVNKETLSADGGEYTSPGQCYLSEADYRIETALDKTWRQLHDDLRHYYRRPPGITMDQIRQIRALCGLTEKGT